jgi:hypothetical protein
MGVPKLSVEYSIYAATYESAREVPDRMRVVSGWLRAAPSTM